MFKDKKEITQSRASTVQDLPDPVFEFMQCMGLLLGEKQIKTKQNKKKWKEVVGGIERYEPCFKKAQDCSFLSAFPRPAAYDQALRKQVLEDSFLTQHHVHG